MITIEPVSIIIFTLAAIIASLSFVVYLGSKERYSQVFSVFLFLCAMWISFRGVYHTLPEGYDHIATLFNDLSFSSGVIICSFFLYFTLLFPENKKPHPSVLPLLFLLNISLLPTYFVPELFLGPSYYVGGIQQYQWINGPLLFLYDIGFALPWVIGFAVLYKKSKQYEGDMRRQLRFMFWTIFLLIVPIEIGSLMLPRIFDWFGIEWFSSFTTVGWITLFSYTIIKHNQMNVKTVYTELLIIACAILLFFSIFI